MNADDTKGTPEAPTLGEIAPIEDALKPLRLDSLQATDPFVQLLDSTDSVLAGKGGIANLKIYTELLRDSQVASTWDQRRLALTECETMVEPGGTDAASVSAADALREELLALNWDDITDKALFAAFYGWGVAEIMWRPEGSRVCFDAIRVRDRARFRFDRDRGLHLWTSGSNWRQMPDRKFWTVVRGGDHHDHLYGQGIANALYWPVFFKRNDIKFWLVFLEKFGMPTAIAKLPSAMISNTVPGPDGKTDRQRAIEMLRKIATDAGVVVPTNDKGESLVELLEAARSGAADYETLHQVMDEAISKVVVGQTMTTDNGSSRSQSEVHERVARRMVSADSDLLCASFNTGPVKWWTDWNFPGAMPPKVYRQTEAKEDLDKRADRDTKIFALGYAPTQKYIDETYGEGWEKKQAPPGLMGMGSMLDPGALPGEQDGTQQFAEGEVAALAALRAARRQDQKLLYDAARSFAGQYQTLMARRVEQLLQAAEFAEDEQTFRRRLDEILAEAPPDGVMDKLSRSFVGARLLAAFRGQRPAAKA